MVLVRVSQSLRYELERQQFHALHYRKWWRSTNSLENSPNIEKVLNLGRNLSCVDDLAIGLVSIRQMQKSGDSRRWANGKFATDR